MSNFKWIRDKLLIISGAILIVSLIGLFISISYLFLQAYLPGTVNDFVRIPGNWNYWILLLAGLGTPIGGWYFYDTRKKMKKFENLMETNSKSKFSKNLSDLEDIAWYLGKEYEKRLEEKKKALRIK